MRGPPPPPTSDFISTLARLISRQFNFDCVRTRGLVNMTALHEVSALHSNAITGQTSDKDHGSGSQTEQERVLIHDGTPNLCWFRICRERIRDELLPIVSEHLHDKDAT